jgi:choice-of-anchor B domain-containing protein
LVQGNEILYSLDAISNLPYRRIAIQRQRDTLLSACEVMKRYAPDMMVIDCADEQTYATDSLISAGLLMANSSDPNEQADGYALLDSVREFVYGTVAPMLPLSDVWGYDDPITGRSYALVGAANGVHIVDVTVAMSPTPVFYLPGSFSLWRDIKIFNHTLYAINDNNWGTYLDKFPTVNQSYIDPWRQDDGLVIIDLSYALQPHLANKTNEFFLTAHNIQTEHDFASNDTTAVCSWCRPLAYVVGYHAPHWDHSMVNDHGGFLILDLTEPTQPKKVGEWNETYIHDIVIQYRDGKWIGYGAAIYSIAGVTPGLYIIDVTDPTNPVTLHSFMAHYNWTHNCWPTDDGKYLYVTHENVHDPITIWNIENISDIYQVSELNIVPDNLNVVAHNVLVRGDRLWISYYSMGTAVYDITDRVNPKLIGLYDTAPDKPNGMDGTWGVYPYANSYNVYSTDMSNGLYVLKLNSRMAYVGPQGPQGPKGDTGVDATDYTKFIIASSIIHGVTFITLIVLIAKLCTSRSYVQVK